MCYTLFPLLTVGKLIPTLKKTHYYGLVLSRILFTVCCFEMGLAKKGFTDASGLSKEEANKIEISL